MLQVMIDHERRSLRLIDWGLAEFYHPSKECALCVVAPRAAATRVEVLLGVVATSSTV